MIYFVIILLFFALFLYNEKVISQNPNYKPKFFRIFARFLKMVVFPSFLISFVAFVFFTLFSWWKIFIENTISENVDAKIVYKRWNRVFHEENVIIAPHKTQKIVIPSNFSEWKIFVKISQKEKFSEISWGIDELYTRPPNADIVITKENEKIKLEQK